MPELGSRLRRALCGLAVAIGAGAGCAATGAPAVPAPLASLPLVQREDVRYLGAFRLPAGRHGAASFAWGGHAIAPHRDPAGGATRLYVTGHVHTQSTVALVEVPAAALRAGDTAPLPAARLLHPFVEITGGRLATLGPVDAGAPVMGLLAWGDRLIVAAAQGYGSDQVASHGVASLDLSRPGFRGFFPFSGAIAPPRALGGPMTPIPVEWREAFGGPALTGNCCLSIISATSAGPSATVFDPATVGAGPSVPGRTVLFHPLDRAACGPPGCEATRNETFNLTTRIRGIAFVPGTRSVLFFGAHGVGPYCYGTPASCGRPGEDEYSGPRAAPYVYRIWAYDALDLVAVRQGRRHAWTPRPYAVWTLPEMRLPAQDVMGAGFDPETGRLYVAQRYGDAPRIDVYELRSPGR